MTYFLGGSEEKTWKSISDEYAWDALLPNFSRRALRYFKFQISLGRNFKTWDTEFDKTPSSNCRIL